MAYHAAMSCVPGGPDWWEHRKHVGTFRSRQKCLGQFIFSRKIQGIFFLISNFIKIFILIFEEKFNGPIRGRGENFIFWTFF